MGSSLLGRDPPFCSGPILAFAHDGNLEGRSHFGHEAHGQVIDTQIAQRMFELDLAAINLETNGCREPFGHIGTGDRAVEPFVFTGIGGEEQLLTFDQLRLGFGIGTLACAAP